MSDKTSDTISRQAAIDALDEQITQCDKALGSFDISMKDEYAVKVERASLKAYRETLNVLPSADRPQGEWIKHEHGFWTFVNDRGERDGWLPDYECNLCGSRAWRYASNYCPNCGADMRGDTYE